MAPDDKKIVSYSKIWKWKKGKQKESQSLQVAPSSQSVTGDRHSSSFVSSISSSHPRRAGSAKTLATSAPSGPSAPGVHHSSSSISAVSSNHQCRKGSSKTAKPPVTQFDYYLPPVEYYHNPELPEEFDKFAHHLNEENPHHCIVM
ncbi:hypothetical protein NL676_023037 [Syzygium grande]|nr:hypothetical protein NL676_023037 [Syzygium grande]